ncbi:hypothetical protein M378DRAFT_81563 [Amanita muscaria Koide BX008]|uniref:Uncharacterized protein n=1 Tax=Amanita muscaria (strain Koide BX008) TaxID=946122 RepID=A0A0C2WZA2_AMAMK|nr:hypothetical protein M378DRAFT_81563 [Amanita muscaria Koide BX008]
MANIIRLPKSSNKWTQNELDAYNIKISFQNATTFFNIPQAALPQPTISEEVLMTESADDTVTADNYTLLALMELAMIPDGAKVSTAVVDFMVQLFNALGYTHCPRITCTRLKIQLLICGEYKYAKPDVCIIDRSSRDDIILITHMEKKFGRDPNPSQLVAGAIATFQHNNMCRRALGLDPLENKIIPGITMFGTMPTFFKIPITTELVKSIECGEYPATPTVVLGHVPDIPRHRQSDGMKPLDNRCLILQCFEAFKQFVF